MGGRCAARDQFDRACDRASLVFRAYHGRSVLLRIQLARFVQSVKIRVLNCPDVQVVGLLKPKRVVEEGCALRFKNHALWIVRFA
jgi:hypothetical protein